MQKTNLNTPRVYVLYPVSLTSENIAHRSGRMVSSADMKYGTTTLIPLRSEQNRAEEFRMMLARTGLQMKSDI